MNSCSVLASVCWFIVSLFRILQVVGAGSDAVRQRLKDAYKVRNFSSLLNSNLHY